MLVDGPEVGVDVALGDLRRCGGVEGGGFADWAPEFGHWIVERDWLDECVSWSLREGGALCKCLCIVWVNECVGCLSA